MKESRTEYTLVDGDGAETYVTFVHRVCGCCVNGCYDDEIRIRESGDDEEYVMQVPNLMTSWIEGLFDGYLKLKGGDEYDLVAR